MLTHAPAAFAETHVSGNVSGHWTLAGQPYVADSHITLPVGQTLQIEPGVIVKFANGAIFGVEGTLVAEGTAEQPIVFTSLSDDSAGGDTNANGPSSGIPGQWNEAYFNGPQDQSRLSHVTLRFARHIRLVRAAPTWNHVTISSMSEAAVVADLQSEPRGSNNRAFSNAVNGIDLTEGRVNDTMRWVDIGLPYVLRLQRFAYILSGGRLTLSAGVIVKVGRGNFAAIDGGEISAEGTEDNPVILTSLSDDSIAGDTNGNGPSAGREGEWGGLQFVRAGAGSRLEHTRIRFSGGEARYVQNDLTEHFTYVPAIDVQGSTLSLRDVHISSSYIRGIEVARGSSVTMTGGSVAGITLYQGLYVVDSTAALAGVRFLHIPTDAAALSVDGTAEVSVVGSDFVRNRTAIGAAGYLAGSRLMVSSSTVSDNQLGVSVNAGSQVSIRHSTIQRNTLFGVVVNDPSTVADASFNYWGSTTGPRHVSNPAGTGDRVSDRVNFAPFTTQTDFLPPRTQLSLGKPFSGENPIYVSSMTPLFLSAVDDGMTAGDGTGSGVLRTSYRIDSQPFIISSGIFRIEAEGSHRLDYFSEDLAGHIEQTRTQTFVVDNTPPSFQIVFSPEAVIVSSTVYLSTATQVALGAEDAASGLGGFQYRLRSTDLFTMTASTFTIAVGTYTAEMAAFDKTNNGRSALLSLVVSPFAPTGSDFPTTATLPDGTPVVASPLPVTLLPPGGATGTPSGAPVVTSVTLFPVSPVGVGPVTVRVQFSKPMDNTVQPQVSLTNPGDSVWRAVAPESFVGQSWVGSFVILPTQRSGTAFLIVSGAKDAAGASAPDALYSFQIQVQRPAPPQNVAAAFNPATGRLGLIWQQGGGTAPAAYNVYRSTGPITTVAGMAPVVEGITARSASDVPPGDVSSVYYAVTAMSSQGAESDPSGNVQVMMPLPPVITEPADSASVDVSSIILRGIAQPGAVVELSTAASGAASLETTTGADGRWSGQLALGAGRFTIAARSRSDITGQISSTTTVTLNASVLPLAPTGVTATPGDTTITLSWTSGAQPEVSGYNIYRNGSNRPLNVAPLPRTQASYHDIALTNGKAYSYILKSVRPDGTESAGTLPVQATPTAGEGWGK